MKSTIITLNILLALIASFMFLSCEEEVEKPEIINFSVEPSTAAVMESVFFTVEHTGTFAVVWTGEPGSDYEAYLEEIANPPADAERNEVGSHDKGVVVSGNKLQKLYKDPGVYTARLIVTNAGDMGHKLERAEATVQVTITE